MLLFSVRLISSPSPHFPLCFPLSSQLQLWLLVILPLSFFQTLMIFLYTGINWGNGPQWLKLNYNHKSLVRRPREGQFSLKLRRDFVEWGYSTIWGNLWQGTLRNGTWKKCRVEKENERIWLRNTLLMCELLTYATGPQIRVILIMFFMYYLHRVWVHCVRANIPSLFYCHILIEVMRKCVAVLFPVQFDIKHSLQESNTSPLCIHPIFKKGDKFTVLEVSSLD